VLLSFSDCHIWQFAHSVIQLIGDPPLPNLLLLSNGRSVASSVAISCLSLKLQQSIYLLLVYFSLSLSLSLYLTHSLLHDLLLWQFQLNLIWQDP